MNHFTLTAAALRRRKARTIFTGLSVVVVFILFGLAMALRHGFTVGPSLAGGDLIMVTGRTHGALPIGIVSKVAAVEGVKTVLPMTMSMLQYKNPKNMLMVAGVPADAFLQSYRSSRDGKAPPHAAKWKADRTGALVQESWLKKQHFDWHVGQQIVLTPMQGSSQKSLEFHVDGIVPARKEGAGINMPVVLHLKYLNDWRGHQTVAFIEARARDAAHAGATADRITHTFANSSHPLKAKAFGAMLLNILRRVGNVGALTLVVIAAALLSLLFVTGNAMAQSVNERRAEFSLLKALGFNRRRIGGVVFGETVLMMAPPALIGLGLAGVLVALLAGSSVGLPGFSLAAPGYLTGFAAIAILIVLSSLVPLAAVMRRRGAAALRET
jgi:putative ABC transport system permease protein